MGIQATAEVVGGVADRVRLELLPDRLAAITIWHPIDAMTLQAAVQRGTGQMRDRGW